MASSVLREALDTKRERSTLLNMSARWGTARLPLNTRGPSGNTTMSPGRRVGSRSNAATGSEPVSNGRDRGCAFGGADVTGGPALAFFGADRSSSRGRDAYHTRGWRGVLRVNSFGRS